MEDMKARLPLGLNTRLILIGAIVTGCIATVALGFAYYRHVAGSMQAATEQQLLAVTQLKVVELQNWLA